MTIEEFAKINNVPVLNSHSVFPDFYVTHALVDEKALDEDFLLCSDLLTDKQFSLKIDEYLNTTKYVFLALGKGYLKTKDSIGLIYDPFELSKIKGANIVMQDLLYELEKTDILASFCLKNKKEIEEIISADDAQILFYSIEHKESLLIFSDKTSLQYRATIIFDRLLKSMSENLEQELKQAIKTEISDKFTIFNDLESKIKEIFSTEKSFINLFFDQTSEERMFELRVPEKHEIIKGLIAVYRS